MRQGQQNRRGRGRGNNNQSHSGSSGSNNNNDSNNNNRKAQNLLSRNYESSGPDVKIRGTAQHIAEKYMHLARDAASSGDLVMMENYFQHAEHYNRIIAAAQAAQAQQYASQPHSSPQPYMQDNVNGSGGRPQPYTDRQPDVVERDEDEDVPAAAVVVNSRDEAPVVVRPDAEQPVVAEAVPEPQSGEQPPRHRRRRRPAGGPEGRVAAGANGAAAKAEPEDMAG
jgi:hypothetical protein